VTCKAIVIGGSAGGPEALDLLLSALPVDFTLPILVVQHLHWSDDGAFAQQLVHRTRIPVVEPCDKQAVSAGCIHVAPADYHMHVEQEETISLTVDSKVNWSRPSIDVLFESAARVWGRTLAAVILSGASRDGTSGMRRVKALGGWTFAQDPHTAAVPVMPRSAIDADVAGEVLAPRQIGRRLGALASVHPGWRDE